MFNYKEEPHLDKEYKKIVKKLNKIYKTKHYDETSYTAYQIAKNIINQKISGNIVECGVFEGEKISIFLETLNLLGEKRDIYIVDTFEGMTKPSNNDYQVINKRKLKEGDTKASQEYVKKNIYKTNYPRKKLHFIKIDVRKEQDLRKCIKGKIALLRIDTDFYDSVYSILNSLYSNVNKNGYLIHDDYGHWKGHYKACTNFYKKNNIKPILIRTSRKERVEIKQ